VQHDRAALPQFPQPVRGESLRVMEAPSKEALAGWFQKMQMPCDYITPVELEGERGVVKEA